ncbi:MAG: hypothetical protein ACD_79C00773G0003 [uncultured bacterium]|nr:MAG: hypothetical protein ACD_79C00773G0003 [uncultured bacterium]
MLKRYNIINGSITLVEDDSLSAKILVYINPTQEEKPYVIDTLHISEYDFSSAMDIDEVPRLMIEDEYLGIIWKQPSSMTSEEKSLFNVSSTGLFLVQDKLVFLLSNDYKIADARFQSKIKSHYDILFHYLYLTIHHYLSHLKVIKMIASEIQGEINKSMDNQHLIQMMILSEGLIYYLNAINGNHGVLIRLRNYCDKKEELKEKTELLDDIMIENGQCTKQAEVYSQVLSGLMDARGSIVNNNMNTLIKKLTTINVIFLPLNLIAGIGGMSEYSMMTKNFDWRVSYSVFMILIIITGIVTSKIVTHLNINEKKRSRFMKKII